jgi:hypothetical protein
LDFIPRGGREAEGDVLGCGRRFTSRAAAAAAAATATATVTADVARKTPSRRSTVSPHADVETAVDEVVVVDDLEFAYWARMLRGESRCAAE